MKRKVKTDWAAELDKYEDAKKDTGTFGSFPKGDDVIDSPHERGTSKSSTRRSASRSTQLDLPSLGLLVICSFPNIFAKVARHISSTRTVWGL